MRRIGCAIRPALIIIPTIALAARSLVRTARPYRSRPYRRVRGADRARLTEVMIKAPSAYGTWLTHSALLWILAFALLLWIYGSMLVSLRVDVKHG